LKSFKKPTTTVYKKKIPFAIEAEQPEDRPVRKTKVIVEEEAIPVSPEEVFELPKKKRTRRKIAVARSGRSKTAKTKRALVVESSSDKSDN
jgi:hypothetical protein